MSLKRNKLRRLVEANDLDGICRWVDDVGAFGKAEARAAAFVDAVDVCRQYAEEHPDQAMVAQHIAIRIAREGRK